MEITQTHIWTILLLHATLVTSQSPPSFNGQSLIRVPEDAKVGSVISTLLGSDTDANEILTFSAASTDTSSLLQVGQSTFNTPKNQWACNLTLITRLDRDRSPSTRRLYFELANSHTTTNVIITLIIEDVNDNPPTFVGLPYRISLPEDTINGTRVYKVSATDPDLGSGGIPNYFIKAVSGDYHDTFEVNNQTGEIFLSKSLDYETLSFYHYNVSATDEGNPTCPGRSCDCDINNNFNNTTCDPGPVDLFITVIDVQDTPPVFSKLPYMTTVPENATQGQSIFQVTAVDGDRGVSQPNRIQYSLSGEESSQFLIDPTDGTIRVNATLDADREEVRNKGGLYLFHVVATEESGNGTENPNNRTDTQITVTVTDVNDNPPKFNADTYSATVLENTPTGVPITMTSNIEVEDIDQDVNSRFWVFLEKGGSAYNDLDTLPGANMVIQGRSTITIRVLNSSILDFETTQNITFQLVAMENNTNPNIISSSVATVTLNILDVNDNSPQFPDQPKSFNVSEDAPIGQLIANINATDADSGDYGTIVFGLEDNGLDGTFNISDQGVITLAQKLNWGVRKSYTLAVIASDSPQHIDQHRQSTYRIQVNVQDVNDNPPTWTQFMEYVTVLEGSTVGTKVTVLKATDLDGGLNAQIEYSIVDGTNGSRLFGVNTTKEEFAEIYVKQSLSDNVGLHILTVMAEDEGSPRLNSTLNLSVFVIDENQNYPIFVDPDQTSFNTSAGRWPEIRIPEEPPIFAQLYTLSATDKDTGLNGQVEYYLSPTSNNDYEYFTVDRLNGTLRSARRLDKETKGTYEIQVTAQDNGQPVALVTPLSIRVILLDINDNQPTYTGQVMPQLLQVVEESSDAFIGEVLPATDLDEAPNNVVCYYLYGGDHMSGMHLDKATRNLSLTTKIDREITSVLNIVIKASEVCNLKSDVFISNQNSSNTTQAAALPDAPPEYNSSDDSLLWVKVTVTDINDNPPQFTSPALTASVIYDAGIGTPVMSLADNITDKDTADNRKNKFKMLNFTSVLQAGDTVDTSKPPFVVTGNGSVNTNMLFQKEILGHFLLYVLAYDDDGLNDTASLKVTLISSSDRLQLVFNKQVNEVEQLKSFIAKQLSEILNINIIMDKIQGHVSLSGTNDPSKTDAYIYGRYRSNGKIVPATELRKLIDLNLDATGLLNSYGVIETMTIVADKADDSTEELQKVFIIVAVVLAVIVVSLFSVLIYMISLYRRRLLAATTTAYASPQEKDTIVQPGTNKYFASENPLFGREIKPVDHDDGGDDDDDASSHNSLDLNAVDTAIPYQTSQPTEPDEEQEMSIQIGDGNTVLPLTQLKRSSNLDNVLQAYTNEAHTHDDGDMNGYYSYTHTNKTAPSNSKGGDSLRSGQGQQFSDNEVYDEIYRSAISTLHLEHTEI